mgnify:CR=1 FL=1
MKKLVLFIILMVLALAVFCQQLPPELGDPPTTTKIQTE